MTGREGAVSESINSGNVIMSSRSIVSIGSAISLD